MAEKKPLRDSALVLIVVPIVAALIGLIGTLLAIYLPRSNNDPQLTTVEEMTTDSIGVGAFDLEDASTTRTITIATTRSTTTTKATTQSSLATMSVPAQINMKVGETKKIDVQNPPPEGVFFVDVSGGSSLGVIDLDEMTGVVTAVKAGVAEVYLSYQSGDKRGYKIGACLVFVEA